MLRPLAIRRFSNMNDFIKGFVSEFGKSVQKQNPSESSTSSSNADRTQSSAASSPSPSSLLGALSKMKLPPLPHLPHMGSPIHSPLGTKMGPPGGVQDALKALVSGSEEDAKALLDQELDFDGFLKNMRKSMEIVSKFRDQMHRFIPGADIGAGIDVAERISSRVIEVAEKLTREEKDRIMEGTISAADVHRIARRASEPPSIVLQLIGTFGGYVSLKKALRDRLARGQKIHGLSVAEAMEIVQDSTKDSLQKMQELGRRVMETAPPPK